MKALIHGGLLVLCVGVVTVKTANCPDGWSAHEESCFLFKKETYNWFNAKAVCENLGGFLAEDTSLSRHNFFLGLVDTHGELALMPFTNGYLSDFTWIGLQDFAEENVFVWSHSGYPAKPTFWGSGEPQNGHGEEDCVMLKKGLWNDLNCEDDRPHFICEKPTSEDEIIG